METLIGWRFAAPLGVNHMAPGTRRHGTGCMDVRITFISADIRIGTRVIVVIRKVAERLVFKIRPGQLLAYLINKPWFGDPVTEV